MSLIDNLFRVKLYCFLRLNANSSLAGIYFAILRCPLGNDYKVSVTGMPFYHISYSNLGNESAAYGGFSPFGAYGTTFAPVGSVSLNSRSPKGSLRIQFPCHPAVSVGRQKESAFMGRLGALIRPTCTSYAGCAQWTIKLRITFRS